MACVCRCAAVLVVLIVPPNPQHQTLDASTSSSLDTLFPSAGYLIGPCLTPTTQKKGPVPIYTRPTTTTAPPVSSRAICCRSPPTPGNTRTHKRISDLRQGGGRRPNKLTDLTACDSLAVRGTDTTAAGSAGKRTPPHKTQKHQQTPQGRRRTGAEGKISRMAGLPDAIMSPDPAPPSSQPRPVQINRRWVCAAVPEHLSSASSQWPGSAAAAVQRGIDIWVLVERA